jgi:hypothetical protein
MTLPPMATPAWAATASMHSRLAAASAMSSGHVKFALSGGHRASLVKGEGRRYTIQVADWRWGRGRGRSRRSRSKTR